MIAQVQKPALPNFASPSRDKAALQILLEHKYLRDQPGEHRRLKCAKHNSGSVNAHSRTFVEHRTREIRTW